MRIVAVDWSGREPGAEEFIWVAQVRDDVLVSLENGRSRDAVVDHLLDVAAADHATIAGLDFSFSFPRWFCDARGWRRPADVWSAMAAEGDAVLARCPEPFWGRPGRPNRVAPGDQLRQTERHDAPGAKSTFQIGGAGAVGTGSVRGMACLPRLAAEGFSVWPFAPVSLPVAVEIYPRLLTGPVNKSRWASRHAYLMHAFPDQPLALLERAAGSQDAFDAAVSALRMAEHAETLARLVATADPVFAIEGRIWRPGA